MILKWFFIDVELDVTTFYKKITNLFWSFEIIVNFQRKWFVPLHIHSTGFLLLIDENLSTIINLLRVIIHALLAWKSITLIFSMAKTPFLTWSLSISSIPNDKTIATIVELHGVLGDSMYYDWGGYQNWVCLRFVWILTWSAA